jgi:MFS family permease
MHWFPARERGIALGMAGACIPVGSFLGVLGAPLLFQHFGSWQSAVSLLSLFSWATLLYCIVIFKIAAPHAPKLSFAHDDSDVAEVFRAAMRAPFTWVGVVTTFAVCWILWSAFSLSPSYFAEPKPVGLGLGPLVAGQLMGFIQLGAFVGPILGGLLLDKVFSGKTRIVLSMGFLFSLTYIALQFKTVYNNHLLLPIVLGVCGAGIGMLIPQIQSRISESYDHRIVGRMNGVWVGIGAFGGATGLFVNSLALKHTGNYVMTVNLISAAALFGLLLCALSLKKPHCE